MELRHVAAPSFSELARRAGAVRDNGRSVTLRLSDLQFSCHGLL